MKTLLKSLHSDFPTWSPWEGHAIFRKTDDLIQAILFDAPRPREGAYVYYTIYPLAIHTTTLPVTLGKRITANNGSDLYIKFPPTEQDWQDLLNRIRNQVHPSVSEPLDLQKTIHYIETTHVKRDVLLPYWALGVLYGLLGKMNESKHWLGCALKNLDQENEKRLRNNLVIPDHLTTWHNAILRMQEVTSDQSLFKKYCDEESKKTIQDLHLVEQQ